MGSLEALGKRPVKITCPMFLNGLTRLTPQNAERKPQWSDLTPLLSGKMMMLNPVKSLLVLIDLGTATLRLEKPGRLPFCAICKRVTGGAGAVAIRSASTSGPMPYFVPKGAGKGWRGGGGSGGAHDPEIISRATNDRGRVAGASESGGAVASRTGQACRIFARCGRILGSEGGGSDPPRRTRAVLRSVGFAGFVAPLRARARVGSYDAQYMASPTGRLG